MRNKLPLLALLIVLAAAGAIFMLKRPPEPATDAKVSPGTRSPGPATVRLIAVGDMLPHDTVNLRAKQPNGTYDYKPYFSEVKPFFDKADIRFCNQESPSAAVLPVSGYPTFNAPPEFAKDLNAIGCNLINLANNHAYDKHMEGIAGTLDTWDAIKTKYAVTGINRSAAGQEKVPVFTAKDIKFAFLAFNEMNNNNRAPSYAVNMFDENLAKKLLSKARQQADVVIVSMHWGTEDSPAINANQEKWAKLLADNGADVVIGTGPHVLQPAKKLPKAGGGETLVWYSIGNFLSSQLAIEELIGGPAVMDFKKDGGKITLTRIAFLPTYMHYEWTQEEKSRDDLLKRKNLKLYPLDQAAVPLNRSLNNTTVEAQATRITDLLNTYTKVEILTSEDF